MTEIVCLSKVKLKNIPNISSESGILALEIISVVFNITAGSSIFNILIIKTKKYVKRGIDLKD